ncbi:MAG: hypothetical protein UR94_C0007G0016 [Parcubacteria group bacterium GW2011_GWA2_36_10]|nr:MAG: hypothetical protein UR94_C0007G0016 [Parcubacteria group bacterium GW2011_GWA2_36_10]
MGEYANVKIKKLLNFIKRLVSHNKDLQLVQGGRHNYLVKYPFWSRPFPIPFKQRIVSKFIVKDLKEALVKDNICTEEEFDNEFK